jgi:hypothetical protein
VKACHSIVPVFDDPNLVSAAGLVPVLQLGRRAGLEDLLARDLSLDAPVGFLTAVDRASKA